jgi:hypothetical protein
MNDPHSTPVPAGRGVPAYSLNRLTEHEKARRWDQLIRHLGNPAIRDTSIRHLAAMRRATLILLASREELPDPLAAGLKAYMTTLNELYLEAHDGIAEVSETLDLLPTYITESMAGELCQTDTEDDYYL